MKRCKTCKSWTRKDYTTEWGYCERAYSNNADPKDKTTLAVAQDYEGYSAGLDTKAAFGCVQWEAVQLSTTQTGCVPPLPVPT